MLSWISRHRILFLTGVFIAIALSVLISATESHPVSRFILNYFEAWATVFRTVGTVTAAYLAYVAIVEGNRIREEARDLEHQRRSLEGVIEWTRSLQKLCFQRSGARQMEEVAAIVAAGDWAVMTAAIFGQDFKNLVIRARDAIASCTLETTEVGDIVPTDTILNAAGDVLEAAFKLKTRLKI